MMGKISAAHMLGLRLSCCALLPAFLLAGPAMADAQSSGMEKASLSLSIFLTHRESSTRLDASVGDPGTDVDLENDLGLDRSDSVFRVDAFYKFNEAHRIDVRSTRYRQGSLHLRLSHGGRLPHPIRLLR
jgi:hypothetical protein